MDSNEQPIPADGVLRVIPVQQEPFNAETPLAALQQPVTPVADCYIRTHFPVPAVNPGSWRLSVDGRVDRPLMLSLGDIKALPHRTLRVTLECAGNGRSTLDPPAPGVPWRVGAVATADFTGTPLHEVLALAGLGESVVEVLCCGADRGAVAGVGSTSFQRSLPLDAALHPDTLLAWDMNGGPLTLLHGAPLRVVVPGWYAMASVKWLERLTVQAQPFDGFFQANHYVYRDRPGEPDTPVTRVRVRALFAHPLDAATVAYGPVACVGAAWSGAGAVRSVEVSTDGGETWSAARLEPGREPLAASVWRYDWLPRRPGRHELRVRATDAAGNTQPNEPWWNALGYGNNQVQRITVEVAAE